MGHMGPVRPSQGQWTSLNLSRERGNEGQPVTAVHSYPGGMLGLGTASPAALKPPGQMRPERDVGDAVRETPRVTPSRDSNARSVVATAASPRPGGNRVTGS